MVDVPFNQTKPNQTNQFNGVSILSFIGTKKRSASLNLGKSVSKT